MPCTRPKFVDAKWHFGARHSQHLHFHKQKQQGMSSSSRSRMIPWKDYVNNGVCIARFIKKGSGECLSTPLKTPRAVFT